MSTITLGTVKVDPLDVNSITKAIKDVKDIQKQLKDAVGSLIDALMEEGVEVARTWVMAMGAVYSGYLADSIGHGIYDPQTRTGMIYADAWYAVFVEYGTGIIGALSPHPEPSTAQAGTPVPGTEKYTGYDSQGNGLRGWYYVDDVTGKREWTLGHSARPFMYRTMMQLKDYVSQEGGRLIAAHLNGG